ncbi:MAG TPA: hypothetical protein VMP11_18380 [Verrucomicrobiae bacterium]|nr:hypothetical protein [Verrucomicrobiae bacterium]
MELIPRKLRETFACPKVLLCVIWWSVKLTMFLVDTALNVR